MKDIIVGKTLPEDFIGTTPEGLSGSFSGSLMFILKMEDLTSEDVETFNRARMSLDLLELSDYKDKIGNLYAFSILVENFIDNSEVLVDFRVENIETTLDKKFEEGKGIETTFVLANEEDEVLAIREFRLDTKLSEIVSEKAYEQNNFILKNEEEGTDYIILAFQKLFENEPEENVSRFSIGRTII